MTIIIAGDGKVGLALTKQLSMEGHDIVAIDSNQQVLENKLQQYDVASVRGNCATMATLRDAGVDDADLLIAATSADEINLLCCLTARRMNEKLHTIARVRSPEYIEQMFKMRDEFGLSLTVNPELAAAQEAFRLLQFPGFLKRETFAKGRVEIVELRVTEGSILENVVLYKLPEVLGCKVLVCTVLRGGQAIIPSGVDTLKRDDHIYVTATTEVLAQLLKKLGIAAKKTRHAILVGGGRVSFYLARRLIGAGVPVKIIEKDPERCIQLAQRLPLAAIVQADGSSQEVLDSEGIATTDALVTLTGMDELNVITSMYGTTRSVPQIVTKVNRMENTGMLEKLDVGSVVSPRELCCSHIVQYVRAMQNQTGAAITLHRIAGEQVETLEFRVDKDTHYTGVPLKDIPLKSSLLIACISHLSSTTIPDGASRFEPGDTVVVVNGRSAPILQLNDIFA